MDPVQEAEIEVGSNRSFGVVFAIVFAVIAAFPLIGGGDIRWWSLGISGAFLAIALVIPGILKPLNLLWFKFGMLLSKIVNPIVMLLIYVISVLPTGLLMQMLGKDLLRLKLAPEAKSYWIERAPPGPEPASLEEIF